MQEDGFLRDIIAHPNDPVPRLIYADWLEEQGDPRGAFPRLEVRLHESQTSARQRRQLRARLRQLRQGIGICQTWLARLDRAAIENCGLRFRFQCPKQWEALQEADEGRVRFCESCQKRVYHCATVEEARAHALRGDCVAVDSRLTWTPGDIDPPRRRLSLGMVAPPPHDGYEDEPEIRLHVPSEAPEEYQPSREQRRRERQASKERRRWKRKRGG